EKNVLAGVVHNDEKTPHMHFSFVPVTFDEKKQREKVSAKLVLNRKDLQTFHQDLDRHLKEKIPEIYQGGILNDKTNPVKNVEELKRFSKDLERDISQVRAE
ncbi:plasmid recombination protein, partial [Enterococcus faecalis]|uniref:plasmid recombination protein n=1 Tax=Enterococcus faecalis TaxID=1351 RepID=UPI003EDA3BC6